ncbi:hypothetical protein EK21DRAFT_87140 [Setomelanomma holmii]|uniref:F-box domain-containing protein n=1 Tax=Setomelanomma holmii TaxID=210430 RepID=A0A9P4LQB0_9PLEO|nr:hypothetical protein EK21DRAFT_87140 [Setomelanomma holmii]
MAMESEFGSQFFHARVRERTFTLPLGIIERTLCYCDHFDIVRLRQTSPFWYETVDKLTVLTSRLFAKYLGTEDSPAFHDDPLAVSPEAHLRVNIQPHPGAGSHTLPRYLWTVCEDEKSANAQHQIFQFLLRCLHGLTVDPKGHSVRQSWLTHFRAIGRNMERDYHSWKNEWICQPPVVAVYLRYSIQLDERESCPYEGEIVNELGVTNGDLVKSVQKTFKECFSRYLDEKLVADTAEEKRAAKRDLAKSRCHPEDNGGAEASITNSEPPKASREPDKEEQGAVAELQVGFSGLRACTAELEWCCELAAVQQTCNGDPPPSENKAETASKIRTFRRVVEQVKTRLNGKESSKTPCDNPVQIPSLTETRFDALQTSSIALATPNEGNICAGRRPAQLHTRELRRCCKEGNVTRRCISCQAKDIIAEYQSFAAAPPAITSSTAIKLSILKEEAAADQDDLCALSRALGRIPSVLVAESSGATSLQLWLDLQLHRVSVSSENTICCNQGTIEWQCDDCQEVNFEWRQAWEAAIKFSHWQHGDVMEHKYDAPSAEKSGEIARQELASDLFTQLEEYLEECDALREKKRAEESLRQQQESAEARHDASTADNGTQCIQHQDTINKEQAESELRREEFDDAVAEQYQKGLEGSQAAQAEPNEEEDEERKDSACTTPKKERNEHSEDSHDALSQEKLDDPFAAAERRRAEERDRLRAPVQAIQTIRPSTAEEAQWIDWSGEYTDEDAKEHLEQSQDAAFQESLYADAAALKRQRDKERGNNTEDGHDAASKEVSATGDLAAKPVNVSREEHRIDWVGKG